VEGLASGTVKVKITMGGGGGNETGLASYRNYVMESQLQQMKRGGVSAKRKKNHRFSDRDEGGTSEVTKGGKSAPP